MGRFADTHTAGHTCPTHNHNDAQQQLSAAQQTIKEASVKQWLEQPAQEAADTAAIEAHRILAPAPEATEDAQREVLIGTHQTAQLQHERAVDELTQPQPASAVGAIFIDLDDADASAAGGGTTATAPTAHGAQGADFTT